MKNKNYENRKIEFEVKTPTDLPLCDNENLKISKWFLAKVNKHNDISTVAIVCYDFKKEKWISPSIGVVSLIEYYIYPEENITQVQIASLFD